MSINTKIMSIRNWLGHVGWRGTFSYSIYRAKRAIGFAEPLVLRFKPRLAMYPLLVRLEHSTDMFIFLQIFRSNEYDCMLGISSPDFILDLGANVGYSSAYFLSAFPEAKIIAIEPDPDNYRMCCKNLAPYGDRVRVVLGAVWPRRSQLVLIPGGPRCECGTQVRAGKNSEGSVDGWDIPSLLEMGAANRIDILKIDIERSELQVFGDGALTWLSKVRNICIELHGDDCKDVFFRALEPFEYDLKSSGELTVCLNIRSKQITHTISSWQDAEKRPSDSGVTNKS